MTPLVIFIFYYSSFFDKQAYTSSGVQPCFQRNFLSTSTFLFISFLSITTSPTVYKQLYKTFDKILTLTSSASFILSKLCFHFQKKWLTLQESTCLKARFKNFSLKSFLAALFFRHRSASAILYFRSLPKIEAIDFYPYSFCSLVLATIDL